MKIDDPAGGVGHTCGGPIAVEDPAIAGAGVVVDAGVEVDAGGCHDPGIGCGDEP